MKLLCLFALIVAIVAEDFYPCPGPQLKNSNTNKDAWCTYPLASCPNNYICNTQLMDASSICCPPKEGLDHFPNPEHSTHKCGAGGEPAKDPATNKNIPCSGAKKECPFKLLCGDNFGMNENFCYCHGNLGVHHSAGGIKKLDLN